jgi:signal transduction histidine kinase
MRRLLPATLWGRLFAILLIGLLAAQLVGSAILLRDRASMIYQASGLGAAQRIAGIVQVLDRLRADARAALLPALNSPQLRVTLASAAPPVLEPSEDVHVAHLRSVLSRLLGEDRPLQVELLEPVSDNGEQRPRYRRHSHFDPVANYFPRHNAAFAVQAQLKDGNWVFFKYGLGGEAFAWPWRLLLTLAVLLISVIALTLLAVRWLTRPLAVLAAAADELGHDMHRPPLPEDGPVEVRRAAIAFNTMQSRLATYLKERERMLAAVSHDLRTPITRLRLRAELIQDESLREKFSRDLAEMEAMTGATLNFLRGAGSDEALQPVDIMALLESLQADMEEAGHSVSLQGQVTKPYPARPLALKRLLVNLLENAINYGKRAAVSVEDQATQVRIVITDEGPGIPAEQLEQVFEPFYRVEGSRSRDTGGVGLGLSLARDIARIHGGEIVLRNRQAGGLEVSLTLPRREP